MATTNLNRDTHEIHSGNDGFVIVKALADIPGGRSAQQLRCGQGILWSFSFADAVQRLKVSFFKIIALVSSAIQSRVKIHRRTKEEPRKKRGTPQGQKVSIFKISNS